MNVSNTTKEEIESRINDACSSVYKEEPGLIQNKTHERTIVGALFCRLRKSFEDEGWDVDIEYNREGNEGATKEDDGGRLIPDLAVHTRGSIKGPNLFALEAKGYWNTENRSKDEARLRRLREKYEYIFLYRLEFKSDDFNLIEVDSQNTTK